MTVAERASQVAFVGLVFDQIDVDAVVTSLVAVPASAPARYLVTPNVDHIVRLHRQHDRGGVVTDAYAQASWCVCDSRVLAGLCRLKGQAMVVAPGSDITRRLLDRLRLSGDGRSVAIVGLAPQQFDALALLYESLDLRHVVAPYGLATDASARTAICDALGALDAAIVLLAVGAPQQELIAREFAARSGVRGVLLCIGASLEFLLKPRTRAPRLVQAVGLEWAFRLLQNPRRLWRRYLIDGPAIFRIAFASTPTLISNNDQTANRTPHL